MTSRKMVIATWMPWTVVSRSLLMSVIITLMLGPAKLQMNWARASGTSTCRNAADGRPAVPASATSHLPPRLRDAASAAGPLRDRPAPLGRRRGSPDPALLVVPAASDKIRRRLDHPHLHVTPQQPCHPGGRGVGTHDLV